MRIIKLWKCKILLLCHIIHSSIDAEVAQAPVLFFLTRSLSPFRLWQQYQLLPPAFSSIIRLKFILNFKINTLFSIYDLHESKPGFLFLEFKLVPISRVPGDIAHHRANSTYFFRQHYSQSVPFDFANVRFDGAIGEIPVIYSLFPGALDSAFSGCPVQFYSQYEPFVPKRELE